MRAERRSKTVAFVATLALTTFGALATASAPTHTLPPAFGTPRGFLGPNLVDRSLKTAFAPAAGTSRSVKGDMAQPVGVGALATASAQQQAFPTAETRQSVASRLAAGVEALRWARTLFGVNPMGQRLGAIEPWAPGEEPRFGAADIAASNNANVKLATLPPVPFPARKPGGIFDAPVERADLPPLPSDPPSVTPPAKPQHRGGWMIQVGAYPAEHAAKQRLTAVQSKASKMLTGAEAFADSIEKGGMTYYRARFAGLDKEKAEAACNYLKRNDVECVIVKDTSVAQADSQPLRLPGLLARLFGGGSDEEEDAATAALSAKAAANSWTPAVALRHVANLAVAARKGIGPDPLLAHEALEVAQWASQSSAAAAIQQMSTRFAPEIVRWMRPGKADLNAADAALADAKPLTAEEVQNLLGANEALVFFLVGANESYVFALTREGFEWRTLSLGEENVSAKVAAFRRGLDVVELTKSISMGEAQLFDLAAAHELYVALFGQVEALIKHKPQLLIVPSGPLTALPFHLLVVDKPVIIGPQMQINEMAAYRDAAWLVKRHAVTVLPSVANLKALRVSARKGQGTKPMIGFGDPVFAPDKVAALAGQRTGRVKIAARTRAYSEFWQGASVNRAKLAEALAPLPDSADELKAVAAKLGAPASDIYLGRNATEANVKRLPLADYRVVYFATHGLVAGDVEGLGEPSLALTLPDEPSELDDGLLTASEVAQLELNADWVVLSACNTAAGEKPGAEALSGLARAFFYAGARALLVSHWGIDSKAAARLATSTFDIMNSDRTIGRAEALRRAMLIYLDDKSDIWNAYPAFWGSFSLVGDGTVPDAAAVAAAPRRAAAVAYAQPVNVYVKTVKTVLVRPME